MLLAQAVGTIQYMDPNLLSVGPQRPGVAFFAYLPMLLGLATWVITLVIIWRAMKAHESIAESLRQIAQKDRRE